MKVARGSCFEARRRTDSIDTGGRSLTQSPRRVAGMEERGMARIGDLY